MKEQPKYINDLKYFRKDFYRTILLIWNAGKELSIINCGLLLLQAILPVVSLYYIKLLIDLIVSVDKAGFVSFDRALMAIIGFSAAQFVLAVCGQVSAYVNTIQLQKLTDALAGRVLQKAIAVDLEYYENPDYQDTLHMAQQKSEYQAPLLLGNVNALILNSLSLFFLIGFFIKLNWFYAFVFVSVSIPLACIKWYYGYKLFWLEKKYIPMEREANYYHQALTGVSYAKEVRSFGFGNAFIGKYKSIRDTINKAKRNVTRKFTIYSLLAQSVEVIIMAFIFVTMAHNAWWKIIPVSVFVIYLQGFQRLQTASKNFLQSLVQLFQQRLFLKDIFAFFDIKPKTDSGTISFPVSAKGLSVEHLNFTYPQTGKQVLSNISIDCTPGKIIAIVGENGSGKSTLVKLLAGLYEVQAGSIKIDGINIRDIANGSFRKQSIFLFQDFEKYFLTIEENIALAGNGDKGTAAIEDAAKKAGAEEFILQLSEQYKTRLGRTFQRAEQLSGGQWQKLALARIFYKNAQLIVLDEPTSHIDAIAEYELFENLRAYAKNKMVILISHRLYNLKLADTIYVMKHGAIAEKGSFDELVNRDGIFREMYNKQKL